MIAGMNTHPVLFPFMMKSLALLGLLVLTCAPIAIAETPRTEEPEHDFTVATLPLTDVVSIGQLTVGFQDTTEVLIPGTPDQPGKVRVLRFRAFAYTPAPAGSNFNLEIEINHDALARLTPRGKERLIGRPPVYQFRQTHPGIDFPIFSEREEHKINLLFAPDIGIADRMTTDGQGSSFALDISDKVSDSQDYTITFRNIRKRMEGQENELVIDEIEVGWLDERLCP